LQDLQKSIELNDNRAVYRSRLLLDQDLAARSASLARIYNDLGFQQLALVEGWKSVNTDPGNYSAHRFLADSYSALPRHEIARVSELLQSQLLQPINITPVQPQLAEGNLFILEGAGPSDPSFNEFNPLFIRNRVALQANGVAGGNDTLGDDLVFSGVYDKVSFSAGQFHYETDGFRENNDQEQDIYNVFAQASLSSKTSVQAEYRSRDIEKGDLSLLFDPDNFFKYLREKENTEFIRFGMHHAFGAKSDLIASYSYLKSDLDVDWDPTYKILVEEKGYIAEAQHLFKSSRFNVTSGIGYFGQDRKDVDIWNSYPPSSTETDIRHTNFYVYTSIHYPQNVTWTLGGSADLFEVEGAFLDLDSDQFNPKFGLTWTPFPSTTFRAATFRTLERSLLASQTLEPTQVAGFNQFFEDGTGTDSWCYGIGVDRKLSTQLFAGAEFSKRDLKVPGAIFVPPASLQMQEFDLKEYLYRIYIYWTPHPQLALGPEYQFERFERPLDFTGSERITELNTHRFSLGMNFFHPCGFSARLKPTYIDQDGNFFLPAGVEHGDDQFWVVDASISYRLPKRLGIISIEAKNIFNENFNFQDTDPSNPEIYPERLILTKFTIAF